MNRRAYGRTDALITDGPNFRISVDKFEDSIFKMKYSRDVTLEPLVKIAEEMSGVVHFTGKESADSKV